MSMAGSLRYVTTTELGSIAAPPNARNCNFKFRGECSTPAVSGGDMTVTFGRRVGLPSQAKFHILPMSGG